MYDLAIVAQTGQSGITNILNASSVNDSGNVAFVADDANGQAIFFHDGSLTRISPASSTTYGAELQLNDSNFISAMSISTNGQRRARLWNAASPGALGEIIASSALPEPGIPSDFFDTMGSMTTLANDGQLGFAGLEETTWEIHLSADEVDARDFFSPFSEVTELPTGSFFRFMAADGDRMVVGSSHATGKRVVQYDITGVDTFDTIASTSSGLWSDLGVRAGISDDGTIVTFFGNLSAAGAASLNLAAGPGIFAAIDDDDNLLTDAVIVKIAGVSGNGVHDPGESFEDANGNGQLDAGETETGPFSALLDVRASVTNRHGDLDAVFVSYVAESAGAKGVYTTQLTFPSAGSTEYSIGRPSKVIEVGDSIAGLSGSIADVNVHDSINDSGQIAFWVTTSTGADAIVRGEPLKAPVLIVPGIAGTFANTASISYRDWLLERGVAPEDLKEDPLVRTYDDLIKTLRAAGYEPNENLFVANYDWRLAPAPVDGQIDGTVSGMTAASITDSQFEHGVDYLGYWMKKALDKWTVDHPGVELTSIDVIAHSTGGLVTRAYIQSAAYGGSLGNGQNLPRIDNFVMLAVPNEGAAKAWNPFNNNFKVDPIFQYFLSKIIQNAYTKVLNGETITGPDGNIDLVSITVGGQPDPKLFLRKYITTIRYLLPTYDFLDLGGGLTNINSDPATRNDLLLDLNAGLNLSPSGDLSSFASRSTVTAIFGNSSEDTIITNERHVGSTILNPGILQIHPFTNLFPKGLPDSGEVWFENHDDDLAGDETVPLQSLRSRFLNDERVNVREFTSGEVEHLPIVHHADVQKLILNLLGQRIAPGSVSTTLAGKNWGSLKTQITAMIVDPVGAVLTDGNGRRIGFDPGSGVIQEIPDAVYIGDSDGIAVIVGPAVGPLELSLEGLGGNYYVQVSGSQGGGFGVEDAGVLAVGATKEIDIEIETPASSADFDGDEDVDGADFLTWQLGVGITSPNGSPANGDADGDKDVDSADLSVWRSQFSNGPPAAQSATSKVRSAVTLSAELIDAAFALEQSFRISDRIPTAFSSGIEPEFADLSSDITGGQRHQQSMQPLISDPTRSTGTRLVAVDVPRSAWLSGQALASDLDSTLFDYGQSVSPSRVATQEFCRRRCDS
jgi:hypothetical protein